MVHQFVRALPCFVLLLTLGCNPSPPPSSPAPQPLRVAGYVPLPPETLGSQVVFFFEEPITWDGEGDVLSIEPELMGEVTVGEQHVAWRAEDGPPPKGSYVFTLASGIQGLSGRFMPEDEAARSFAFTTYSLLPEKVVFHGQEDESIYLAIWYAAEMRVESLREALAVRDGGGNPVDFEVEALPLARTYALGFPKDAALPLSIEIGPGVHESAGRVASTESYSFSFPQPGDVMLESAARMPGREDLLQLQFNESVYAPGIGALVGLERDGDTPAVPIHVETDSTFSKRIQVRMMEPVPRNEDLMVRLEPGVLAQNMARSFKPFAMPVTDGPDEAAPEQEEQELQISYHFWNQEDIDGPSLYINFNGRVDSGDIASALEFSPVVENMQVTSQGYQAVQVTGDFRSKTQYKLSVDRNTAREGGEGKLSLSLEPTPLVRRAEFTGEGKYYFPQRHGGQLSFRSRNLEKVTVHAYRLFPNNLVDAIERLDDGYAPGEINVELAEALGRVERRIQDPRDLDPPTYGLDLQEVIPDNARGVFSLHLEPSYEYYRHSKLVLWTDIGVLSHWRDDALVLFAHNLFSTEPLADASVTVYSRKRQVMVQGSTGPDGIAVFNGLETRLGTPKLVVVEYGEDFTFIELEPQASDAALVNGGAPAFDRDGYDAFLYTDRNLYRPGAGIHARWLVRTDYGRTAVQAPLAWTLIGPKNNQVASGTTELNDVGAGGVTIASKDSWPTGAYRLSLTVPGENTPLGSVPFNLEEFVPNRIRVNVDAGSGPWVVGRGQEITVHAEHYMGSKAKDREVSVLTYFRPGTFTPDGFDGLHFGNSQPQDLDAVELGSLQTDAQGAASFQYTPGFSQALTSPVEAVIRSELREAGGRPVVNSIHRVLVPDGPMLGLAAAPGAGEGVVTVQVGAAMADGAPAQLEQAEVVVERKAWRYYVRRFHGGHRDSYRESFVEQARHAILLEDGRGRMDIALPERGAYRLRLVSGATPHFSEARCSWWWYGGVQVTGASEPSLLTLTLDKARYRPGESALLTAASPFEGQAVTVFQNEGFQHVAVAAVSDGAAVFEIPLEATHVPNLWVTVTAVNTPGMGNPGAYPYSSARGISIPVEAPETRLTVEFDALPETTLPGQPAPVSIYVMDAAGQPAAAEITAALVDEGIHAILGYETPEPFDWFMRNRRPLLQRAHYYDKVAYDFEPVPMGGSGMAARYGKDTPEIGENWIKPLALWSGPIRTGDDGRAEVQFDLPEFNGEVRVVAVAAAAGATGSASASMKVKRPYVLRTSMPRFVRPGDDFASLATVFNTTDAAVSAELSWLGVQTLYGEGRREGRVEGGGETTWQASVTAHNDMGPGAIRWRLAVRGEAGADVVEEFEESASLPVRPAAGFEQAGSLVVLEAGESRRFDGAGYLESAYRRASINVTANPLGRLQKGIDYLLQYPHGCVEQTTSRAMPLLLLRKAWEGVDARMDEEAIVKEYIAAAVDRLLSMQLRDGGLAYWPGGNQSYPYGSVYAAHFLTMVKLRNAYPVSADAFGRLQNYLRAMVAKGSDDSLDDLHTRAYAIYVLALDGEKDAVEMVRQFDAIEIPTASRYLLAAVLARNLGDMEAVEQYLAAAPSTGYEERRTWGGLNSPVRNAALRLLAALEFEEDAAQLTQLAEPLMRYLEEERYPNTHDMAFTVAALGAYTQHLGGGAGQAAYQVNGPEGDVTKSGTEAYAHTAEGDAIGYTVTNSGESPVFVYYIMGGTPEEPATDAVSAGLAIERLFGKEALQGGNVRLAHGDTLVVMLQITCDAASRHVVVSDLLPGGLEVANPRLDEGALESMGYTQGIVPSHLEVRDDRFVLAFDRLDAGTHTYYYLARAVTPGTFQWPGGHAECMYAPHIRGRSAALELVVESKE